MIININADVFYELAVLGAPNEEQIKALENALNHALKPFCFSLGREVGWSVLPETFRPSQQKASAVVYFGGTSGNTANLEYLVNDSIPILPVVEDLLLVGDHIPDIIKNLNCLQFQGNNMDRVATALLECVGLLPRQRRVFISYKRSEARMAALQLFDALSACHYDVFLDTHGIAPAEDFQTMLWHRLCDSDVLLMLDTPTYFESRWTAAEYGRALAKGISILRVEWPETTASPRTATANRIALELMEVENGTLISSAISRITSHLELLRSQSFAVRARNMISQIKRDVEKIGGRVHGVGKHQAVSIELADTRRIMAYPTLGIPVSTSLHEAAMNSPNSDIVVVYDHIGIHPQWLQHLEWLGQKINKPRWLKSTEAAWALADWEP